MYIYIYIDIHTYIDTYIYMYIYIYIIAQTAQISWAPDGAVPAPLRLGAVPGAGADCYYYDYYQ